MKPRFLFLCLMIIPGLVFAADPDDSLRKAAKKGDLAQLEALLRGGANPDSADKKGRTALIEAAVEGQAAAVRLLLQNGARPNLQDEEGFTALRAAAVAGHSETVRALLDGGADLNFKCTGGFTALMVAAVKGRTEVVRLLLSRGADVSARSDIGLDALCLASQERQGGKKQALPKYPETIQALLDGGASPAMTLCFIDPDYLIKAPRSFAILPVEDLRTADEKKSDGELPAKLAEGLKKELSSRKYEILPAVEVQKKFSAGGGQEPHPRTSAACSLAGTDAIFQVQLLASKKRSYGIADVSGMAVASSLTDCRSGRILWKDWNIYAEYRGFIIARFVSGARMIASIISLQMPRCPKK